MQELKITVTKTRVLGNGSAEQINVKIVRPSSPTATQLNDDYRALELSGKYEIIVLRDHLIKILRDADDR